MKKITLLAALALTTGALNMRGQTSCSDLNGYPQSKNTGGTGAYTLIYGQTENAAQTYHYSGPGKITSVRIYGYTPNLATGVSLDVKVYHVDGSGRPTSIIGSKHTTWDWGDNLFGHKDVSFLGGGYALNSDFAVSVEISNGITSVTQFQVTYNGDGEGLGENLSSLGGTSTGDNWVSAKDNYSKDGDFYILPRVTNFITADFNASTTCAATGSSIQFDNTTSMTTDSMFNKITSASYAGSNHLYAWDFGDGSPVSNTTNPTHSYSTAGAYTVTLTSYIDGWNGVCSNSVSSVISVGLDAGTPAVTSVGCYGAKTGSFTVTPSGGQSPYTYSIDDDTYASSNMFSALDAGVYTVYVKDANGCSETATVTVSQPAPIIFSPVTTTNASCNTSNGAIQSQATGGNGALQYSINGTSWQSSGTFNSLPAGGYTIWAQDGNNCTSHVSAAVVDFGGPTLSIAASSNVSCAGLNNGSILAAATGGSGTLMYSIDGINYQSSGSFSALVADTFFVSVKDASGCIDIETVYINEPPQLKFSASSTPATCYNGTDGTITITGTTGGTGTMSYSLDGNTYQSSNVFTGVTHGTYLTSVKDAAGCVATKTIIVLQPSALLAGATSSDVSCYGMSDGSIVVSGTGGTPRYTFSIDGETFFPSGDFTELGAGTYTLTVMDHNGCTYTVNSTISQPSVITSSVTIGKSTCGNANGNILIAAAGGSGSGYQYSIDGSNWNSSGSFTSLTDSTYEILVTDGAGCSNIFAAVVSNSDGPSINSVSSTNVTCYGVNDGTINVTSVTGGSGTLAYQVAGSQWQTSTSFTGLPAGSQTVIVKDGLGCTGSYDVTITEPVAIVVNAVVTNPLCYGIASGSITINAGGGSGTLAYSLDADVYQSNNTFSNMPAGHYHTYVRDAGGCLASASVLITSPLPVYVSNAGALDVTCNGDHSGSLTITATGGTGSLQYSLDGTTYQSSNNFTSLDGGAYTIYVKDANGCVKSTSATIAEPAVLASSAITSDISCYGGHNGSILMQTSGGTPGYTYNWSNQLGNGSSVSNLYPGTYSVTITDAHGCIKTVSSSVSQPASPLIVNATIADVSSSGASDGSVVTTVTGGTAPYTYSWSNSVTTANNYNLSAGTYIVTISDANGCVSSGVFTVGTAVGIAKNASGSSIIKLYPNPASSNITVESNNQKIEEVEILSLVGEVLYHATPSELKTNINLDMFSEGIYLMRYKVNNSYTVQRFNIMK